MLKRMVPMARTGADAGGSAKMRRLSRWSGTLILTVFFVAAVPGFGQSLDSNPGTDLTEMSLEELMNLEVTSVSKKAEPIMQAPSAVFVITQDDIHRSGATSVPDMLRMVPGVHVGRIDANKWAVSVRGFNGSFANKLLVLIDGRSVYTPLFSGVYWDVQDVVLDDIERIEVIRGPGATLWGANAVNGVINIITKSAPQTQRAQASLNVGNKDRGTATFRFGRALNNEASLRVWVKRTDYGNHDDVYGRSAEDHWNLLHGGFRLDYNRTERATFTFQGDLYSGQTGQTRIYPSLQAPFAVVLGQRGEMAGSNLLGRWNGRFSERASSTVQVLADYSSRSEGFIDAQLTTFDLDCQQNWLPSQRFELTLGAGVRTVHTEIDSTTYVYATPSADNAEIFSAFVQAKVNLIDDHLSLTGGSKFEHNSYTGYEYQPSVRALWQFSGRTSMWAAVSRAVRTPSIGERIGHVWLGVVPPLTTANPTDMLMTVAIVPSPDFDSEHLLAKEIGMRFNPSPSLWIDATAYANEYDDLILAGFQQTQWTNTNPPMLQLPVLKYNGGTVKTTGTELVVDWQPMAQIKTQACYTYLYRYDDISEGINISSDQLNFYFPKNMFGIRLLTNPAPWCDMDVWARYIGRLPNTPADAYTTLDARLAVRPIAGVEVALVGNNLFMQETTQFVPEINTYEVRTPRSYHCTLSWEF